MNSEKNPLKLSGIGLGTFPFSHVFGKVTEDEIKNILHTFLRQGGMYIQTAPYYEGVEELLGKMLKDVPRESYQLATLCIKNKDSVKSGKRESILKQCDASLSRLGLNYLDLLMTCSAHYEDASYEETIGAMLELKKQGKIRALGVCNVTLSELKEFNKTNAIDYVQVRLSLIDQEASKEVRSYCVEKGIGIIPYNILEWGLLTSKMLENWNLREGDLRTKVLPVFKPEQKQLLHEWIVTSIKPIADLHQTTIETLSIAWALSQPGVVTSPVGATSTAQIISSMNALVFVGKQDLLANLQYAYEKLQQIVKEKHGLKLNAYLKNSYGAWN